MKKKKIKKLLGAKVDAVSTNTLTGVISIEVNGEWYTKSKMKVMILDNG